MRTSPARIEQAIKNYITKTRATGRSTALEQELFEALEPLWRGDVNLEPDPQLQQHVIVDINVYDNATYPGLGGPGAQVAAYDVVYGVEPHLDADPVIHILIPNWYPPGWDDDHWCAPNELPRRIRRALIAAGAVFS